MISYAALREALILTRPRPTDNPFSLSRSLHPPAAIPKAALGQDAAIDETLAWAAQGVMSSAFAEGQIFLGYPLLAVLAQRPEYRVVTETIAGEMTREWIEFKSTGEDDKSKRIKELTDEMTRLRVRAVVRKAIEGDGFFGRGHIYIDTAAEDNELKTSLGNGRNFISRGKVGKKGLKALRAVEATWCYPTRYDSVDPLKADWYAPRNWFVMGKEVHYTRLLTLVGREVPDMLKPVYSFGGLSISQMIKTYVDNWLRTRQSVSDFIHSFSVMVLKTDLQAQLSAGGQQLIERVDLFNQTRDNRGLMLLDKEHEEFGNVSASLATLDALQAQSQEQMASVARIPIVKLLGIQPAGLNASSEGEIRSFYDWIKAFQEMLLREPLTTIVGFTMLSLWGKIDSEITFDFKDLWQLDEAGKTAVEKTKTDIDDANVAMGSVSPEEVRWRVAKDPDSQYAGLDLDPEALPEPPPMEGEGEGFGEEETGVPQTTTAGGAKDPSNRLATSITNRAANVGGAAGEGFGGDELALDAC